MENKGYREFPVISNEAVVENIYRMDLGGDFIAEPGQFFMLRSKGAGPLLSRPLSICDISQGYLTFLYAVVGEGTAILSRKRPGDAVQLLGPLGNSYKVKSERKTALIGGGIGIAPLLYIAKTAEIKPDIYLGFRDAPFFEKEFEAAKVEATQSEYTYVHKFKQPFEYQGKIYKELIFDWDKLTGKDGLAIENELQILGKTVIVMVSVAPTAKLAIVHSTFEDPTSFGKEPVGEHVVFALLKLIDCNPAVPIRLLKVSFTRVVAGTAGPALLTVNV